MKTRYVNLDDKDAMSGNGGHHAVCLLAAVTVCLWIATPLVAQSVPKERRITHREQSLKPYDPFSAEEIWKRIKIPPSPFLAQAEALKAFRVAPGFRIECVAAEPLVVDPVMFEFDPDGRIWVVEFRGWMRDIKGTGEGDPIGRVVVLEDTDGDAFMDKSTVFLDKLVMPRTVSFVAGGVLVAEPPNLWYCRDTDGDLKCDRKELVGKYGRAGNPEHTDNGLMHAIDNWMYSAKSTVRHKFVDGKLIAEATMFRGQWGMTQDDYGRLFYNYENKPLHGDLFPAEYLRRNKHISTGRGSPGMNVDVAAKDHEVFPIRVTPGITLGGTELRDDGTLRTFTIACGPSIYRGDQFPEKYYGNAVIPEAAGNLVRLARITSDGVSIESQNAFNRRELLATTDERFRPVCSRTGPDGALYVCDLYRGIIEHVIFMMPYLRNQILSRGLDKPIGGGRIYRIVHDGKPLAKPPHMSAQASRELIRHLSHPNGWWRDTAQRLLVERKAVDVADALRAVAVEGSKSLGRLHALWTLEGIGQLDWDTVSAAVGDEHAMVRATAVRLSERFLDVDRKAEVFARLESIFEDRRPMVRLQMLLTLGEFNDEKAERQMAVILLDHPTHVFRNAAVSGLQGRELEFIARLIEHPDWNADRERQSWTLETLAKTLIDEGNPARVERVLDTITAQGPQHGWRVKHMLFGVLDSGLSHGKWPTPIKLASEPKLLDKLARSSSPDDKRDAARLLRIVTWPGDTTERAQRPVVKPLTAAQEKRRVMGEAVYNVTCYSCHKGNGLGQPDQAPPLADSDWVNGAPERLARIALHGLHGAVNVNGQTWNLAMPGLGHSPILNDERMAGVLTYVRRAWGNYGDAVEPELIASIRKQSGGRTSLWTVEELLNPDTASPSTQPSDPLKRYRPLLASGDAQRGRVLFHTNLKVRCNACHKVGRLGGGFVGPDLTEVGGRATSEQLLESLIEPSAKIAKGYETMVVMTESGRIVSGTLVSDDGKKVVVALTAGGTESIAVNEIEERVQSSVSSMPPMGHTFTAQEIADLVAYLASLKSAADAVRTGSRKTSDRSRGENSQSLATLATPTGANRLTYLDADDPYYVSHRFPKLTTPMWVGEPDVECVVILSIDDLSTNNAAKYEQFLRPVLARLKEIDGRAPVSIFSLSADPRGAIAQRWLGEGLSLEVHTVHHPCPVFKRDGFEQVRATVHDCLDQLSTVPQCRPVAFRAPCCDVLNSNSPRLYREILIPPTAAGNFLAINSTVHHIFTRDDPELPRNLAIDEDGRDRFAKFTTGNVPILGKTGYQYVNFVANYPYPYIVSRLLWEIPCHIPGDHQAAFYQPLYGRRTVKDWKAGLDAAMVKQGVLTLVFHPHGRCEPADLIALIDHATRQYGKRVKFLTMREAHDRLTRNLLDGHPLRGADGQDNGVRLLDVNHDGFLDVVIGNAKTKTTRLWSPQSKTWKTIEFPTALVAGSLREPSGSPSAGSRSRPTSGRRSGQFRYGTGVQFGVLDSDGLPTVIVRNEKTAGAWQFDGAHWVDWKEGLHGFEIDGRPVLTANNGRDRGVRLRDVDGDGRCELLVSNESQNAVFAWSDTDRRWNRLPYTLPVGASIVDAEGRDAGLRFVDINGDGTDDVIFSNDDRYSVHEFDAPSKGWTRPVIAGTHDGGSPIPRIVRGGANNGAFIHSGRLWVVNEKTVQFPNHAHSVELSPLTLARLDRTTEDVSFVADSDGSEQKYVLVRPKQISEDRRIAVLIALHGHGSDRWQFVRDPRDECRAVRDVAATHGMLLVSPDYRAKTSWMGPMAETDVVQIIKTLKKQFRVDRVIVAGGSMGGTGALTFAVLHPELVDGVVSLNGTADLVHYQRFGDAISESFGGSRAEVPDEYRRRSAAFFPEKLSMPVAVTTGGRDSVVPADSVLQLSQEIRNRNPHVLSIHRPQGGHSTNYDDTKQALKFVIARSSRHGE